MKMVKAHEYEANHLKIDDRIWRVIIKMTKIRKKRFGLTCRLQAGAGGRLFLVNSVVRDSQPAETAVSRRVPMHADAADPACHKMCMAFVLRTLRCEGRCWLYQLCGGECTDTFWMSHGAC